MAEYSRNLMYLRQLLQLKLISEWDDISNTSISLYIVRKTIKTLISYFLVEQITCHLILIAIFIFRY